MQNQLDQGFRQMRLGRATQNLRDRLGYFVRHGEVGVQYLHDGSIFAVFFGNKGFAVSNILNHEYGFRYYDGNTREIKEMLPPRL